MDVVAFNQEYCDQRCDLFSCNKDISTANSIDMSNCGLTLVPNEIQRATHLQSLDLSFNTIKNPEGVSGLRELEDLNMRHNRIRDISGIGNLPKLTRLNLRTNEIDEIGKMELRRNRSLKVLDLSINNIREIKNLDKFKNLEILLMSNNTIGKIENLESLDKLRILRLNDNRIPEIEGVNTLTNLERLDLRFNEIPYIEGLKRLRRLKKVELEGNPLKRSSEIQLIEVSNLLNVRDRMIREEQIARNAVDLSRRKEESGLVRLWDRVRKAFGS